MKINHLAKLLTLAGTIACGLTACSDTEEIFSGIPQVTKIASESINKREKIILYGENLTANDAVPQIFIDNSILPSDSIKFVNMNRIEFMPTEIPGEHTLKVIIGSDTSKVFNFTLNAVRSIEMSNIIPGNFEMGSLYGLENEKPVHKVTLTQGFEMSKHEISQALYIDVMGENPSLEKNESLPVHNIDFITAVRFCNSLSKMMSFDTCYTITNDEISFDYTADGYRLPTEAEWEYVCRAGSKTDFAGGLELGALGWYVENSGMKIHEAGKLSANAFGIYDLHGNVWEWCWDYLENYSSQHETDPVCSLPSSGESQRVLRGGAFNSGNTFCRSSNRTQPVERINFSGIRLVRNK